MIVEWSVDISPESPWLVLPWEGWVNLQSSGPADDTRRLAAMHQIPEVQAYPDLSTLLLASNQPGFASAKVDVFFVAAEEVDPEIAEYGIAATAHGLGSYLDIFCLLPAPPETFSASEAICRQTCASMRSLAPQPDQPAYAEIVLRRARLYDRDTFGWTLYAVGFGPDAATARHRWQTTAALLLECLQATLHVASIRAKAGE